MQKKKQQEENLKKIKAAQAQNKRKFLPKIENKNREDTSNANKKDAENLKLGMFNKTANNLMLHEQNKDAYKTTLIRRIRVKLSTILFSLKK